MWVGKNKTKKGKRGKNVSFVHIINPPDGCDVHQGIVDWSINK